VRSVQYVTHVSLWFTYKSSLQGNFKQLTTNQHTGVFFRELKIYYISITGNR